MEEQVKINYREIFSYTYDVTGNNSCIISGYKSKDKSVVVPTRIINTNVTKITDKAFADCEHIEQIFISDGVSEIGAEVFSRCKELKSVVFPDSIKVIGPCAFEECIKLQNITLPNGILFLGEKMFCNCQSLEEIHIPLSVRSIGFRAFEGCNCLKSIYLPAHFVVTPTLRAYYGIGDSVAIIHEEVSAKPNNIINDATVGTEIEFGNYPCSTDGALAPIKWNVIAEDGDKKLLLASYALDFCPRGCKKWSRSYTRLWLNFDFPKVAFSKDELQYLCYNRIKTPGIDKVKISNRSTKIQSDKSTNDLIFLLSVAEIEQYLNDDLIRIGQVTEYAQKQKRGAGGWMTRSDIASSYDIATVNEKGKFVTDSYKDPLIRPCIYVSSIPQQITFEDELLYSSENTLDYIIWLLCNTDLTSDYYDSFLTNYIIAQKKKVIPALIIGRSIEALNKVFSIPGIITEKELLKYIDSSVKDGNTEMTAFLLQQKQKMFQS